MKKNGEERTWDTYNGVRVLTLPDYPHLADEEVTAKFNRACDFHKMDPDSAIAPALSGAICAT